MATKIEWCDETINPVIGCTRCSPGCDNCYVVRMAHRLGGNPKTPQYKGLTHIDGSGVHWTGEVRFVPSELEKPRRWRKPRTIFISSMGDLFHDRVPVEWIDRVMQVVEDCPQHRFILLTKRAANLRSTMTALVGERTGGEPLPNLAVGVSCCTQPELDEWVTLLLDTPAACRFVSMEPLIEEVNASAWFPWQHRDAGDPPLDGIICGAETGPGARPMHPDWARRVRDDCAAAGVLFFLKRLSDGTRRLYGREHNALPWQVSE